MTAEPKRRHPTWYIGRRYHHWLVISAGPAPAPGKARLYLCRCDCGAEHRVTIGSLVHGRNGAGSTRCYACAVRARTAADTTWATCPACKGPKSRYSAECQRCANAKRHLTHPRSLQSVADDYGISRQRVHQLIAKHGGYLKALRYLARRATK